MPVKHGEVELQGRGRGLEWGEGVGEGELKPSLTGAKPMPVSSSAASG